MKRNSTKPVYLAYTVDNRTDDQSFWTRIGAVWDHEDGKGLNLQIAPGIAVSGKIVMREPKED